MMRFADTDVALATVVGHEIAHDLMGHIDKRRGNAAIGMLFDLVFAGLGANTNGAFARMGAGAFSREFEAEADYVGLYLEARAHYPIAKAPDFWRRMGALHPDHIKDSFQSDHPAAPARFVALEKTVAEIAAKEKGGRTAGAQRQARAGGAGAARRRRPIAQLVERPD